MTPSEYQKLAARTIACKDPLDMGRHGVMGLMAEIEEYRDALGMCSGTKNRMKQKIQQGGYAFVSEVAEAVKYVEDVKKEYGDIWWMIAEIATANGIDLTEVWELSDNEETDYRIFLGELAGAYQKTYQGHDLDPDEVKYYLYCIAGCLRGSADEFGPISDIWEMNIAKLQARYPDGFEAERSLHRAEGDN